MSKEEIVMFESDEAAQLKTVTGWVSRDGIFFGKDERTARWSGCTHQTCECGNVFEKGRSRCRSCQAKVSTEQYYALPMVEWDGVTPVCTFDDDRFFFDEDSVLDWLADLKSEAKEGELPEVQLVLCDPGYLHLIHEDTWADDLSEDGEIPDDVVVKLEELNEAIKAAKPVCWWPGKSRIDVELLWAAVEDTEGVE